MEEKESLLQRKESLLKLKEIYEKYRQQLDAFKFEKMKYVRAYDNFTTAMNTYESMSEDAPVEELQKAEAEYIKWKNMAGRDYDSCMDMKQKGEETLSVLRLMKKELMPQADANTLDQQIEQELSSIDSKLAQ